MGLASWVIDSDPLDRSHRGRIHASKVAKKRPDGTQPCVAGTYGVAAVGFQVIEKGQHDVSIEILDAQAARRATGSFCGKEDQQSDGVAIGRDRRGLARRCAANRSRKKESRSFASEMERTLLMSAPALFEKTATALLGQPKQLCGRSQVVRGRLVANVPHVVRRVAGVWPAHQPPLGTKLRADERQRCAEGHGNEAPSFRDREAPCGGRGRASPTRGSARRTAFLWC